MARSDDHLRWMLAEGRASPTTGTRCWLNTRRGQPWGRFWYYDGMRTTIDKAGRLVIPKAIRERVGLVAGEVEVVADGTGLRVEPIAGSELTERTGRLVIPASGTMLRDDDVRTLRDGAQR